MIRLFWVSILFCLFKIINVSPMHKKARINGRRTRSEIIRRRPIIRNAKSKELKLKQRCSQEEEFSRGRVRKRFDQLNLSTNKVGVVSLNVQMQELKKISCDDISCLLKKLSELKRYDNGDLYDVLPSGAIRDTEKVASNVQTVFSYKEIKNLIINCFLKIQETYPSELGIDQFYLQKAELTNSNNEYCIVGDIHGDVYSLAEILKDLIKKGYLNTKLRILRDNFFMLFTGDYADRGFYGVEVWSLLLLLKLANWDKVFLLGGNHETESLATGYGFREELYIKYRDDYIKLFDYFVDLFHYLPQAFFIKIKIRG